MNDDCDKSCINSNKEQTQTETAMEDKTSKWTNSTSWGDNKTTKTYSDGNANRSNANK